MGKVSIEGQVTKQDNFPFLQNSGTTNIIEPSELGETLKELNNDDKEPSTKMSGIDMRSRLHFSEISGILAIDTLVSFNFIPERCLTFTRQKKRLSVSLSGKGRQEIVDIAAGKREQDVKKGLSFGQRIMGAFGGGQKQ
jgi:hypothetical protein